MILLKDSLSSGKPPVVKVYKVSFKYEDAVKNLDIDMNERGKLKRVSDKLVNVIEQIRHVLRELGLAR